METPRRALRNLHLENIEKLSTPLRIPPSPFMKNLGCGTGVNVYRLERSPKFGQIRSPFAVKRVSQRAKTHEHVVLFNKRIEEEAAVLRKLSHPNIVGFRGITKSQDGFNTLVLECCKTSLGDILEERVDEDLGPLPAQHTLKMILDVASALDYLHTEAKLLHGDLKSFNVLVKGDFEICKLCDFGVSLPMDESGQIDFVENQNLRYVGTNLWSAPEVLDDSDVIDCKADIFSFGLIIYETIALVPPHTLRTDDIPADENCLINSSQERTLDSSETPACESLSECIDNACGTRPPLPQAFQLSEGYNRIVELFYCCTNESPEDRPTAKVIKQALLDKAE